MQRSEEGLFVLEVLIEGADGNPSESGDAVGGEPGLAGGGEDFGGGV